MAKRVLARSSRARGALSLANLFAQGRQPTSVGKSARRGKSRPCNPLRSNYSRVAKRRFCTTKRRLARAPSKSHSRSVRHVIVQNFKTSIGDTRQRIVEDVAGTLAVAEQNAMASIEEANSTYSKKLDHFQSTRRALREPFQSTSQQSSNGTQHHSFALADRVSTLRDTLSRKQLALDAHWKDWANVQQKICHLGIEMLGPEIMSDSRCGGISKKKFHTATSAFKKRLAVEERMQETGRKQSIDVENLTTNTEKQLANQEKASQSDKKNRREQMLQLAKQMMACV